MTVVQLQHQCNILSGSDLRSIGGNGDVDYGGGGSGPARARSHGGIDWDDWDITHRERYEENVEP